MSSALAIDPVARPLPPFAPERAPAAEPAVRTRPALRPRVLGASLIVVGVGCVLAAQLVLSIGTADGAFRLQVLQDRSTELAREQAVRTEQLATLAAPQHLASRAAALGMVPQDVPAYLTPQGTVVGVRETSAPDDGATRGDVPDARLRR